MATKADQAFAAVSAITDKTDMAITTQNLARSIDDNGDGTTGITCPECGVLAVEDGASVCVACADSE